MIGLLLGLAVTVAARKAHVLTEDNFDHDTQMMGAATTGDWLVLFCETQQKKECREMMPFWDSLSGELYGKVSVATVDT